MDDFKVNNNGNEVDPGEPIAELARLRELPVSGFLTRIRNSIQLRLFASDALDFSFMAFFHTFLDFLGMAIQACCGTSSKQGERK